MAKKKTTADKQIIKAIISAAPKNIVEVNNLFQTGSTDGKIKENESVVKVKSLPVKKSSSGDVEILASDEAIANFIKSEGNRVSAEKKQNTINEYKRIANREERVVQQKFGSEAKREENPSIPNLFKVAGQMFAQKNDPYINSPYYGKSYAELTNLRKGVDARLDSGEITQEQAEKEKNTIDMWRVRTASKDELAQMLREAEEYKEYYTGVYYDAQRKQAGYNRGVFATKEAKEENNKKLENSKEKVESIKTFIGQIKAQQGENEVMEQYNETLVRWGKVAIGSGASDEYVPTKYAKENPDVLVDTHDIINANFNEDTRFDSEVQKKRKDNYYDMLTDGELRLYNTLYNSNPDAARKFLSEIRPILEKRSSEDYVKMWSDFADKNAFTATIASVASVGQNLTAAIPAVIEMTADSIGGDISGNGQAARQIRASQAIRQSVAENLGSMGGFLYNTGMSIADNLANLFVFGGAGTAASSLISANLAGSAAASGMISAADRGGSDSQIIFSGIANGAAEYVFEKISTDNLFKIKGAGDWKTLLKQLGTQAKGQMITEGKEELLTEIANILSDAMIMQGQSENARKRREYVMQGMSAEEATRKVIHESITQVVLAGAAGAISGGFMSTGASVVNNMSRNSYITRVGEKLIDNPQSFNRILQIGVENGNQEATAYIDADTTPLTARQAGKMAEGIITDALAKKGDIASIARIIGALEGRDASYLGSKESFDTARAVLHFANETATKEDTALLEKSSGAITMLTAIEGDTKAWESVKNEAVKDAEYRKSIGYEEASPQMEKAGGGTQSNFSPEENIENDGTYIDAQEDVEETPHPSPAVTPSPQGEGIVAEQYDIPEGSKIENNIVVDEYSKKLKGENPRAYSNIIRMAKRLGMNVRFVKGLTDKNGKVLDGLITSKGIFINADAKNPSRFVATHEFSHRIRQAAPEEWAKYQEYVINKLKRESFDGKRSKYEAQFEEKLKAYGKDKSVDYINEEIAADYIGDLFKNESELEAFIREDKSLALKVRDWWYNALERMGLLGEKKKAQQMWLRAYTAAGKNVAEGKVGAYSGEKYYINPTFNRAFDNWDKNLKRRSGITLKVGRTSEPLISIGVHEQEIKWDTTKINDTLKTHPDIDIEMLKSIPNLIENPILIMEERNKKANKEHGNNRIFVLGELYNENNLPIVAFLELEPTNKDGIYLNEIKIVSTHSRVDETAPESFERTRGLVKNSHLLYLDPNKNRTNNWLARTGLQLPFLPTTYGPINKITYTDDFVNTHSMQNTAENAQEGKKSVAGTRLSELEAQETARNLERENAELRKQLENLHIQLSQAEGKGLDTSSIRKAAQDMRRAYGSKIGVAELHQELTKLYTYMSGKDVDGKEVANRISAIARKVIENATETIDTGEYADLIDTIRNTRIAVPEDDKASFADGYEHFRKRSMGKIKLAKDGYPLDALWDDLVQEYPYLFSEELIGSEERLDRILEVRNELLPVEESVYKTDGDFERAVKALENDIMESFFEIPEGGSGKYVFYDKRAAIAEKTLREREKQFNEAIGRLDREYKYKVEKAQEQRDRYRDRFSKDKLKRRINSDYNYISRMITEPTDQRHVPEDMRAGVAALLDCFNFETVRLDRIKDEGKEAQSVTAVKLSDLHDKYSAIMKKAWGINEGDTESNLLDEYLSADLLELKESLPVNEEGEFKRLQDMSADEMWAVSKVLKGIHHAITQRNKTFSSAIKEDVSVLGEDSIAEMEAVRSGRKGSGEKPDYNTTVIEKAINKADKFFNLSNVQPWDMFHRLGGTLEKIYSAERNAFNKHIENIRTASAFIKEAVGGLNLKDLTGKKVKKQWIELDSGESILVSKGQAMALYALYQRKQGQEHILHGGIVTNAEAKNQKGEKISSKTVHKISEVDAGEIFKMLSDDEKAAVRKIVGFMSKTCAAWGNETSMKLYGYEKYGEGWYFPIKVSKDALTTYYGEKGEGTLRSQSFTKKLVKHARNSVEIGDFFDIVTEHINGMSLYNTLALPMLDMERVLNYTQHIDGELPSSVRQEIIKTFGKDTEEYIRLFHKDVNGSRKNTERDDVIETLMSNAKKASIGMNMRVLLQQPTSIARILLFVNPRDIPATWNAIAIKKEMQEKMPIAYWKSRGFRDIGIGKSMKEVILDNETLYDKAAMGAYGQADDFTWSLIYATIKNEVKRKNPNLEPGSTEFYEKVRERFDYIVDRSQVVDSVFHRTQNMRSGNTYTKTATMFMSEPLKTYNMYRTEMLDAVKNGNVGKKAARATAVFVISNFILALAQALPDAWREDDEKKLFDEQGKEIPFINRYMENVWENMKDNSNPATYLPYIKDIVSLVKGYTAERMEYSNLSDLIASGKQIANDKIALPQKILNFVKPAAALFGISAASLIRDVKGLGSSAYRAFGDEYADYTLVKLSWNVKNEENREKFMKHYKRALQNGHSDVAQLILQDYMAETFKGYDFKNDKAGSVLNEMSKVYSATKEKSALYSIPEQSFSYNSDKYEINDSDFPEYVSGAYDELWNLAYKLVTSEEYQSLTPEEKAEAFGDLKDYSEKAQRQNYIDGYGLEGWQKKLYDGELDYADYVVERKHEREYQNSREKYIKDFNFDMSGLTNNEQKAIESYVGDAATYYAQKEHFPDKEQVRHFSVYDEELSDVMGVEEYLQNRAKAKKTAAMTDGKENMSKDELQTYLDSTNYSTAMKAALFRAIGNKGWKNPYDGTKNP